MTSRATERNGRYVSTGHLPSPRQVQAAIDEAYGKYLVRKFDLSRACL